MQQRRRSSKVQQQRRGSGRRASGACSTRQAAPGQAGGALQQVRRSTAASARPRAPPPTPSPQWSAPARAGRAATQRCPCTCRQERGRQRGSRAQHWRVRAGRRRGGGRNPRRWPRNTPAQARPWMHRPREPLTEREPTHQSFMPRAPGGRSLSSQACWKMSSSPARRSGLGFSMPAASGAAVEGVGRARERCGVCTGQGLGRPPAWARRPTQRGLPAAACRPQPAAPLLALRCRGVQAGVRSAASDSRWIRSLHSGETGTPGGYVICPSIIFLGSCALWID